jgi:hypothetical protein
MHLDSLLSEFAGVIPGFDLGDEIGPTAWDLVRHASLVDARCSGIGPQGPGAVAPWRVYSQALTLSRFFRKS